MAGWLALLERLATGLEALERNGISPPRWTMGGGTALMLAAKHRLSRDIDAFIDAPDYLTYLSPRLGGESVWNCSAYEEGHNFLKLRFPEGEIDFIAAGDITALAPEAVEIEFGAGATARIRVEHPVEIALKKLFYRGRSILVRDAFDICVVDELEPELLRSNLRFVSRRKTEIERAAGRLVADFVRMSLDELDVLPGWENVAARTHERFLEIVSAIPDASR